MENTVLWLFFTRIVAVPHNERINEAIIADYCTPFEYDQISNEIYKCFIADKRIFNPSIGTWNNLRKVEERIASICKENNGRYFKTQAKTAKFAIIFDPQNRKVSNINSLREKGYLVTTFEKALLFFGIANLWDCERMVKAEVERKEAVKALIKQKKAPTVSDEGYIFEGRSDTTTDL